MTQPPKPKRCRRLTKEERKAVWADPDSNAGAGWVDRKRPSQNPRYNEREINV